MTTMTDARTHRPINRYIRPLTDRQARVLLFIGIHIHRTGYAPTLEETGTFTQTSKVTVHGHVESLIAKGYLIKQPAAERGLSLTDDGDAWVRDREESQATG